MVRTTQKTAKWAMTMTTNVPSATDKISWSSICLLGIFCERKTNRDANQSPPNH